MKVSINSTSEEVRSFHLFQIKRAPITFPLIQLPRKSEVLINSDVREKCFSVSINSTSEEVRSVSNLAQQLEVLRFPLIQLPRKSEAGVLDWDPTPLNPSFH